jgi:hypothetical protein
MKAAIETRQRRTKDQKRIPLSMRITPALRDLLVSQAAENGRSITQEAEIRLQQSFTGIDELFDGRVGFNWVKLMYANFKFAAEQHADNNCHPKSGANEWLRDRGCFEAGLSALVRTAWAQHPDPAAADYPAFLEQLYRRWQSRNASGFVDAPAEPNTAGDDPK